MRNFLRAGWLVLLFCGCTVLAHAQKRDRGITEEDKKRIIQLFEEVPADEYRLVFDNGEEVYGKLKIEMNDLRREFKKRDGQATGIKWTFIAGDRSANEVVYIYTEGMSKMASLLGRERFETLQQIADKYEDRMPR